MSNVITRSGAALLAAAKNNWRHSLLALIAGALLPFSLAPYNVWPVAIVSITLFFYLLDTCRSGKQSLWLSWCFGVGMYGTGVSWIFVSIYFFGQTSFALALVMISLFIMFMALLFALPFFICGHWPRHTIFSLLLGLPALWVVGEWFRTWIFTGFPWLYPGYGHLNTWLAGWAPITGVLGIGFVIAFTAATIVYAWHCRQQPKKILIAVLPTATLWAGGLLLKPIEWTETFGEPIKVGMVQGNIPQEKKMDPSYIDEPIERYIKMSYALWDNHNDWIIWPEAAVPLIMNLPYHDRYVQTLFADLREQSIKSNSALVLGIRYYDTEQDKFYNAILGLGLGAGTYFKQRLVPFGEYVPFEEQLRGIISFFDLPTSIVAVGPYNERGIQIGGALLSPSICYEIVYPDTVAKQARNANILITISNDAWFGKSIGPLQHMQIAQMRALETGRELIRSTNNGVSGFIDHRGHLKSQTAQFVQQTLEDKVQLRRGMTPFMYLGSEPITFFAMVLVVINLVVARRSKRSTQT